MNTKSLNDRLGRVKSGGLLGFLLGLSILLSGTIFYLSEILFIVSLIILFHKFRVDLLRLSVSLLVISFWLIFYFNSTILANEIVLVMLLVLIPSFSLYLNNDYVFKIAAGIKLLLTYSAYLAIILLFVQILTPSLSYWIDPCLYGSFRS
jgi:signal transduction histidine kinase